MTPPAHQGLTAPSTWVVRWSGLVRPGGRVLDLACGSGRHLRWFAGRGHAVWGVDKDIAGAKTHVPEATLVEADIEQGPWPLMQGDAPAQFDAVVVTNYLWRPCVAPIRASLAAGGVLIYETFAVGNESVGRPARADFLLRPAELLDWCAGLQVVAYENGFLPGPDRFVQRIAAVRAEPPEYGATHVARYAL